MFTPFESIEKKERKVGKKIDICSQSNYNFISQSHTFSTPKKASTQSVC